MKRFQAHSDFLYRIKQSPFNTNHVATCSYDNTTKIWDSSNNAWTIIRSYTQHTSRVYGIDFIDEDTIASGSKDQTIKIWSLSSGQTIRTINANSEVNCLKLLKNRVHLTAGLLSGDINIYNINDGSLVSSLKGHTWNVNDLVQISDEIFASSGDTTVRIWNLTANATKFILQGHGSNVNGLKQISFDIVASGSNDNNIKLWNVTNGTLIRTLTGHYTYFSIDLLNVTNGGEQTVLISGSVVQSIKTWNWKTGKCLNTLNTSNSQVFSLAVIRTLTTASVPLTTDTNANKSTQSKF